MIPKESFLTVKKEVQSLESKIREIQVRMAKCVEWEKEVNAAYSGLLPKYGFRERWLGGRLGGNPTIKPCLDSLERDRWEAASLGEQLTLQKSMYEQQRTNLISEFLSSHDALYQNLRQYKTELVAVLQQVKSVQELCGEILDDKVWKPTLSPLAPLKERWRDQLLQLGTVVRNYNSIIKITMSTEDAVYWPASASLETFPPLSYQQPLETPEVPTRDHEQWKIAARNVSAQLSSFSLLVAKYSGQIDTYCSFFIREVLARCRNP